jgi:hypothetical protein
MTDSIKDQGRRKVKQHRQENPWGFSKPDSNAGVFRSRRTQDLDADIGSVVEFFSFSISSARGRLREVRKAVRHRRLILSPQSN